MEMIDMVLSDLGMNRADGVCVMIGLFLLFLGMVADGVIL